MKNALVFIREQIVRSENSMTLDTNTITAANMKHILSQSTDSQFVDLASSVIAPALEILFTEIKANSVFEDGLTRLGEFWSLVGLLRLNLLSPKHCMDPVNKMRITSDAFASIISTLWNELHVRKKFEQIFTGNEKNAKILALVEDINELSAKQTDIKSKVPYRSPTANYEPLFNDIQHFVRTIAEKNKLLTLIQQLSSHNQMGTAAAQEIMWQDKTNHFVRTLKDKFADFSDITEPVQLAIYNIKFGLRLLSHSTAVQSNIHRKSVKVSFGLECSKLQKLLKLLLKFPDDLSQENHNEGILYLLNWHTLESVMAVAAEHNEKMAQASSPRQAVDIN